MDPPDKADHPGVIAFPPLIFVGCAIAGGLFQLMFPLRIMNASVARTLGIVLASIAGCLSIWAFRVMKANGTNVRPDQPATTIVRGGPFRFTRNPMYLSLCLLQLALGLSLNAWFLLLFLIPLALILHFGVVRREESYLEAKFGEPYLALKREVRRWL
jgi:protein-S-isoprenylcysteine O-methyltransferase Ste14